jgi:hypothetical protein
MQAFVAGQEPDKDCSGADVQVSRLPYYLQRPFYVAKEAEPTQAANDASAQAGEGRPRWSRRRPRRCRRRRRPRRRGTARCRGDRESPFYRVVGT